MNKHMPYLQSVQHYCSNEPYEKFDKVFYTNGFIKIQKQNEVADHIFFIIDSRLRTVATKIASKIGKDVNR